MPLRLPFFRRFSMVDDGYKSVPVVPKIKDHVVFYRIGILERSADRFGNLNRVEHPEL